jgi:hypothetical protein
MDRKRLKWPNMYGRTEASFVEDDPVTGFWYAFPWCAGTRGFRQFGPYQDRGEAESSRR